MARSAADRCVARWVTAVILLVASGTAARAQVVPNPDCAKAATPIERTVCKSAELSAADRKMTAAYASLVGKLAGPARDHLVSDQARWRDNRDSACVGEPIEIEDCLETRYRDRTAQLEWLADGAYPFISEQAIVRTGVVRGIPYFIDASYPQFDSPGTGPVPDFSALNRQLAAMTGEAAGRSVPGPDADNGGGNYNGPPWAYEQAYTLHRPGPNAITVYLRYDSYEGGAHSMVGVTGVLVDLRSGMAIGPEGVFSAGSNWLGELTRIASTGVNAPNLADLLKEPRRYVFLEDHLELSFNPNEGGPYTLEIPYERLRSLLRPGGPIPR